MALTGGRGFVGRHVLSRLPDDRYHVRALVRDPARLRGADARVDAVDGSLSNTAARDRHVEGADSVIHLVGIITQAHRRGQQFVWPIAKMQEDFCLDPSPFEEAFAQYVPQMN